MPSVKVVTLAQLPVSAVVPVPQLEPVPCERLTLPAVSTEITRRQMIATVAAPDLLVSGGTIWTYPEALLRVIATGPDGLGQVDWLVWASPQPAMSTNSANDKAQRKTDRRSGAGVTWIMSRRYHERGGIGKGVGQLGQARWAQRARQAGQ